jgi:iron complex outermembrane receptor protein
MTARTYYDYFTFKGDYVYDSLISKSPPYAPPFHINKDYFEGQWWGGEVTLTTKSIEKHTITFGSEYKGNFKQDQTNYDEDPYLLNLGDHRTSRIWSAYIQDEYHLFKDLIINAGVRYDYYSTFGDTTNPRAAVIYSPLDKTTFKFIYGTAFRAPNAFELYYNYPACGLVENPDLKPEKITTYEVVYEQYLGDHLRSSVSGFTYKVKNRIALLPDPIVPTMNSFQNEEAGRAAPATPLRRRRTASPAISCPTLRGILPRST